MNPSKLLLPFLLLTLSACGKNFQSEVKQEESMERTLETPELASPKESAEAASMAPEKTAERTPITKQETKDTKSNINLAPQATAKPAVKSPAPTEDDIIAAVEAPKGQPPATPDEQQGAQPPQPPPAPPQAQSQILDSCFSPDEPCDQKIIHFITSARSTLDIAVFSFTHPGIAAAIVKAQKRGVRVRMVVDRHQAEEQPRSQVDDVKRAGIPVKYGNSQGYMHNKFTIVDGRALQTGSYNYTWAATSYNAENQLYLKDPHVIGRYQRDFDKLWQRGFRF